MSWGLWFGRTQRFAACLAGSGFAFLGVALASLSLAVKQSEFVWWIWGALFIIWILQACFEYDRKTHDPTWALRYQDMWDACEKKKRPIAARAVLAYKDRLAHIDAYEEQLADIDDVLDVLEDIGFYVRGGQISPEAARHHFYHWIRGYWFSTRAYINAWRRKEPTRWQHIEPLFQVMWEVGRYGERRENPELTEDEIALFLRQEVTGESVAASS